jgi:protein-tyrosine phosphatase
VAIADGVALGRIPSRSECAAHATINLCGELPGRGLRCYVFPMLDLIPPDLERLVAVARAIEAGRRDGPVLVYCALGNSRSASAIATWLAMTGRSESVEHAIATARRVRPHIVLGDDAMRAIAEAVERAR